jgi:hypothetical protein
MTPIISVTPLRRPARAIRCACGDLVCGYCDARGCGAPVCDRHIETDGKKTFCPKHSEKTR